MLPPAAMIMIETSGSISEASGPQKIPNPYGSGSNLPRIVRPLVANAMPIPISLRRPF
jgi:hypothetical protein